MSRQVNIDKLNVRLPKGWQGDPTLLVRQVAEQIQRQAADLQSMERIDLNLHGHFAGDARQVVQQLSGELVARGRATRAGRRGG